MWSYFFILLIINYCPQLAANGFNKYKSYKKYMVQYDDDAIRNYFIDSQRENSDLDFWLIERNATTVAVDSVEQASFENILKNMGLSYKRSSLTDELNIINTTTYLDEDTSQLSTLRTKRQIRGFFTRYPRYHEIVSYLKSLVTRYPQYCRYESLGRSYEGRQIVALTISLNSRVHNRRVAYIQGGVHAREWVAPLAIVYFAAELLTNLRYFPSILKDVEIVLVPLVNPDGYEYSMMGDPFWRKNRHRYSTSKCSGVDINRNFANHWNTIGSSSSTCSEVFAGTAAASEPETVAVVRYLQKNRKRVKLSVDVHSYGGFIFYPYGYSRNTYASTRNFLHGVATRAASQISKYRGTLFKVGTAADLLYEASGGLDDYAYGNLAIPMAFTMELAGDSFHVPASDIVHICKETFAGFVELVRHVALF